MLRVAASVAASEALQIGEKVASSRAVAIGRRPIFDAIRGRDNRLHLRGVETVKVTAERNVVERGQR